MTDPFEALREPVTPVDPDPGFARRLRLRLSREVFAPTASTPHGRNHVSANRRDRGRARARLASGADPVHRRVRRPARHGLVHRGIRRAAPRRALRQRGRHDRPRRGRHRRRGADVRRAFGPVARRARPRTRLPHDVQPHPPPAGRRRRRDHRAGPAQRRRRGTAADRPALWARLGDRRPVRAPLDAAATADGSHPAAPGRRRQRDDDGARRGPGQEVLRGRAAGAVLFRSPRRVAHRRDQAAAEHLLVGGRGAWRCSCPTASTTSPPRSSGSGPPAAARPSQRAGRSGCSPTARTTRARRSASGSRPADRSAIRIPGTQP